LPNAPLFKVLGIPSLAQIAGHHIIRNHNIILERFGQCLSTLTAAIKGLTPLSDEYIALSEHDPVKTLSDSQFLLNLISSGLCFDKELIGLSTGVFLNLRHKKSSEGLIGSIKQCKICKIPATQVHFLNSCPVNTDVGEILRRSTPHNIIIPLIYRGDFSAFYMDLRNVLAIASDALSVLKTLENLAKSAALAASLFVSKTLSLMET